MPDSVSLCLPRDSRYYAVARLVVGGMAAPLDLSYDALDDLQLAITSLLDHDELAPVPAGDDGDNLLGEVHLRLSIDDERLVAAIGSFVAGSVDRAFDRSAQLGGELDLRRMLDTIVDDVHVGADADGDEGEWITLTKLLRAHA